MMQALINSARFLCKGFKCCAEHCVSFISGKEMNQNELLMEGTNEFFDAFAKMTAHFNCNSRAPRFGCAVCRSLPMM